MDRGLLNRATSADFEPVSGFALKSICGSVVSKQLEEYLVGKLEKDHSGVKLKVLRIIRYCCENDCGLEFRRLLQRKADAIRRAQSFRGIQDPLRGDSPNKAVRDEAQLVLKALFSDENASASSLRPPVRMESLGSVSNDQPVRMSSTPTGSMGNPSFDNYTTQSSFSDIMRSETPGRDFVAAVQSMVQTIAAKTASYTSASYSSTDFRQLDGMTSNFSTSWVPPKLAELPSQSVESAPVSAGAIVDQICLSGRAEDSYNVVGFADAIANKLSSPVVGWLPKLKLITAIDRLNWSEDDQTIVAAALTTLVASPQCGVKAKRLLMKLSTSPIERKSHLMNDLLDFGPSSDVESPPAEKVVEFLPTDLLSLEESDPPIADSLI